MKKIYLAIFCMAIISCSKEELASESITNATNKALNFDSYEKMDQKIDEITATKANMEAITAQKYISQNALKTNPSESTTFADLRVYHSNRLADTYNLRKELNFVSIQSIADEINSLKLLDPDKSAKLFLQYEKFLKKNKYELTETIFENRTAEVINKKGEVTVNGKSVDFTINDSQSSTTSKFISSSGKQGIAAKNADLSYVILFSAGRETHKDDFGKTFFRYFTAIDALYKDPAVGGLMPCPSLLAVNSASYAGFSQSGSNPFADFAFTMSYPGGSGSHLSNIGGQKWTAYQTEGGYIKGAFAPLAANIAGILMCDFQYNSDFLPK